MQQVPQSLSSLIDEVQYEVYTWLHTHNRKSDLPGKEGGMTFWLYEGSNFS